ncbi:MAG: cupin domain-containing protein, partial [Sphingomonadaceae bacterium]|nr:cupin domain-containing protein [Sphingomonadaceae bacterium]
MVESITNIDDFTCEALTNRLVRYTDLIPCYNAFIDCRTPGSEAKENFTIIGPGVSENPEQYVHIAEPHGYNIGGARQPPGCVNSQHSHDTAEVFVVHSGHWRFDLGEHGDDAQIDLHPGDVISIPTQVFRGFTATDHAEDGSPGFLWAVLGQDNPGRVTWAPVVFDMAKDYGLVLLENGSLVDTAAGEVVPTDVPPMAPTSRAAADALNKMDLAQAQAIVWRHANSDDTSATPIIGEEGPLNWDHGFKLDRIDIAPGETVDWDDADGKDVLFIHRGSVDVACEDGFVTLGEGDTISLPDGLPRRLLSDAGATVYVV